MIKIPNEILFDIALSSTEMMKAREIISSKKDPLIIKEAQVAEEIQYDKLICAIAEIGEDNGN